MKITKEVIDLINTRDNRLKLCLGLKVSENTCRVYINENREDGELTKKYALRKIEELTGLTESEILEDNNVLA